MIAKGHMLLASAAILGVFYFVPSIASKEAIVYPAVIFGSLLPDIDKKNSYIGRKMGVIAVITDAIFKHRTFTHYLIFPLLLAFAAFLIDSPTGKYILFGIAFGVFLHDVGDMLTKAGIIGFFYPFLKNTRVALLPRFLRFYTNSVAEHVVILILFGFNILLVYFLFFRHLLNTP